MYGAVYVQYVRRVVQSDKGEEWRAEQRRGRTIRRLITEHAETKLVHVQRTCTVQYIQAEYSPIVTYNTMHFKRHVVRGRHAYGYMLDGGRDTLE